MRRLASLIVFVVVIAGAILLADSLDVSRCSVSSLPFSPVSGYLSSPAVTGWTLYADQNSYAINEDVNLYINNTDPSIPWRKLLLWASADYTDYAGQVGEIVAVTPQYFKYLPYCTYDTITDIDGHPWPQVCLKFKWHTDKCFGPVTFRAFGVQDCNETSCDEYQFLTYPVTLQSYCTPTGTGIYETVTGASESSTGYESSTAGCVCPLDEYGQPTNCTCTVTGTYGTVTGASESSTAGCVCPLDEYGQPTNCTCTATGTYGTVTGASESSTGSESSTAGCVCPLDAYGHPTNCYCNPTGTGTVTGAGVNATVPVRRAICVLTTKLIDVNGTIIFSQRQEEGNVTEIDISITGLPDGAHGFHIHTYGNLTEACESTGAHYNPLNKTHGGLNDTERHMGDLGNVVSLYGTVSMTIFDSMIQLSGIHSIIGRACVVHSGQDDLGLGNFTDSKTNGHSGTRVACGVIGYGLSDY